MTRACADEFGTRENLREHFSEEQLVELTLVIALANFTNRFNNGLNVQVEHETALSTPVALPGRGIIGLGRSHWFSPRS